MLDYKIIKYTLLSMPTIPNPPPVTRYPSPGLSRYWLLLGVTALAIAGLFSLVLVVARTPQLAELPLFADMFHKALVVHVDLSVMVWFLSIACMMWSLLVAPSRSIFPFLEEAALISFALGTLAIAASAFDPHGQALMSNYIPVITSPVFFMGLGLLLSGVMLMLVRLFTARKRSEQFGKPLRFAIFSAGFITLMAIVAFFWSHAQMPRVIDGQQYYDLMFWGGGHVLQFTHVQMLLVCWIMLVKSLKPDFRLPRKWLKVLLSVGVSTAAVTPLAYLLYDVTSMEHRMFFTHAMMMVGGIAPLVLALFIIPVLWWFRANKNALWTTLAMSVLLFIWGGALGNMIQGENVVVPAHYHGSIVGVTLAFMGAAYLFLPQFGYRDVSAWRLAFWQPIVYGGGQILHISGLAWSGGYGVLRKTTGGVDALPADVKVAMGFMGLGGLIAIIGGLLFVVVVWRSVRKA